MDYTEEQISLAFDRLPRSTQDILFTPEIKEKVQLIGAPLSSITDGVKNLDTLANMAILKLADEERFAEKLIAKLQINPATAQKITSDIFSQIINPIRLKESGEITRSLEIESGEEIETEPTKEVPPAVNIAPANIPTGIKEEPLMPPLTPKVIIPKEVVPEVASVHPFEQKLQGAPAPASTPMPATFTPEIPVAQAPQNIPVSTPASNGSARSTITHDPYREPVE